jgi:hypothetical protein
MNTDRARRAACFALFPLLAGCASIPSYYEQAGDAPFGEANRQTMMAQVIDPNPVYSGPMVTSGDHAADAIDRYHNDAVTEPETLSTTKGTGGGSGGGSGGS